MGTLFLGAWALFARKPGDPARLLSGTGLTLVTCQYFNATLFPLGIATAPVAPVLLGVATAPVWSALLARTLHGEVASRATWAAIALVLLGIAIAISGKDSATIDRSALLGALCGLGVALTLAVNFVTLRFSPDLPLLLAIGCGAALAGLTGLVLTGPARMTDGTVWAILVTALFIIPVAFFTLSQASRHTSASNVSLLLLLETVLGPLWVWLGTGEAPGPRMLAGGALVVGTLTLYLLRPATR